ncbi:hypothetical protein [Fluviispira vulneris]|uniref:hypothetical protein n=1 Tax=Fluviispira vulneris TaxID=2763012 RepID=UPI00164766E5|nr:hypothetical protein [Fluviispira vulneris]
MEFADKNSTILAQLKYAIAEAEKNQHAPDVEIIVRESVDVEIRKINYSHETGTIRIFLNVIDIY